MTAKYPTEYLAQLRQQLDQSFSQEELMTLCFDMGVDYEDLVGVGGPKLALTRNLIAHMVRRDRLSELVRICTQARPNAKWPEYELTGRKPESVEPEPQGRPRANAVHRLNHSSTRTGPISVFQVVNLDRWPYEAIESTVNGNLDDPIHLVTNLQVGTKYRCIPSKPNQSIDWGLLSHNINGGKSEDANGNALISTNVRLPNELWIQVDYNLFHSTRRHDDVSITLFRNNLMSGQCISLQLWGKEQAVQIQVGSLNDPWFEWYEMGTPPSGEMTYAFASSVSPLQYINAHTIPKGVDYQLVLASIVDFRAYRQPPTYRELLQNFDLLNEWFLSCGGEDGA